MILERYCRCLMKTQGIEVYDAGRDVSVDTIIEKAVELNVDIIGTSALLTTTLPQQRSWKKSCVNAASGITSRPWSAVLP